MKLITWKIVPLAVSMLAAGCSGGLKKHEIYAAYGDDGTPTYYRINLDATGYNGAVDYRAGWYDATAVDDLFGDIGSDSALRSELAKEHRQYAAKAMKAYLDVLIATPEDAAAIEIKKKAFEDALGTMKIVAPPGVPATSVIDYAHKKFIIVFSHRPDEVIAAVKGQVQKRQLLDAVSASLRAQNDAGTEVLRARLEALGQSVDAASKELEAGSPSGETLRKTLAKIQAESEVIP